MILTLGTTPALQRSMTFTSLAVNDVNRAARVHTYASGKGINAARVIHTLGAPCLASGFLGGDSGATCRHDMDAIQLPHRFVSVAGPTRMCITLVDQLAGTATELIEEATAVTPADADALLTELAMLLPKAEILLLSGTLAPGCGDDFYARCIQLAQKEEVKVLLDAKGPPLQQAFPLRPFLVKPNRAELEATMDKPIHTEAELREAICAVHSMGAQWIVVTHGAGETIVSDGQEFWRVKSPKVQAVSPIGSGDSFAAGLAVGLLNSQNVPEACLLAAACGTANALTDSAGHLRPEDVKQLQSLVKIESM